MSREKIIKAGVRNLRAFGYATCDEANILTDAVYKEFFLQMLRDNLSGEQIAEILNEE